MQIGMLKLAGLKDQNGAVKLAQALRSVAGVDTAEVSYDKAKASITYDEDQVSLQQLKAVAEAAGYPIARPAHGEGSGCCGGCGG